MRKILPIVLLLLCAVPCVAQDNISARRPFGQHTVAFSATPTFDAGVTENWKMTLTGNVTSSTLIGAEAGMFLKWEICQDATGSRTFAWPSQLQNPITIVATANACTTEIFYYDGTNGLIPVTTTSGGGGSGTVNGGTPPQIGIYTASTTISADSKLDDGGTTPNTLTYTGTGGISAPTFNATGTGAMTLVGTEGTCSGAAAGKDVLCLGDSVSHSIQESLNGSSFFPNALHQSTSPTSHGIMVAETFPQMFALPTGTSGQPMLSNGSGADPGFAALNLAGGATIVSGILPKANHPASTVFNDQVNTFTAAGTLDLTGSTVASAFKVPVGAGLTTTVSGAIGYDSTNNLFHGGQNSADSFFVNSTAVPANNDCMKWVVVSGNKTAGTTGSACGAGGATSLSGITAATTSNSINNGDFAQTWNASLTTSGKHWFTVTENSASTATGSPYLFDVHSIASSTANPFIVTALGTANGWNLLNSGALWAPVGTGAIAVPGTAHGVVVSEGGSAATATPATGTAGQVLISNGASADPSFQDPIVSQAFVNIWNAQDITVTRTSANVRNPIFSQSATLQLTFAGITGSPASCTLQFRGVDSQGNVLNNGGTVSISPANGTSSQTFTAAATLQTAAQVSAVYACGTYPTAGTLTLDFTPIPNVNVTNTVTTTATNLPATVDTNSGTKSASTIRVVLATDQPQLTNKLLVTPDANSAVNVAQVGGSTVVADPCQQLARSSANINLTAGGRIIVGASSKQTYICSMELITATAQNIALVEGTGTTCATSVTGMAGGSTAATGWNFGANGGFVKGTGNNWVFKTATAADDVCLLLSSTGQTSGSVQYVQQ